MYAPRTPTVFQTNSALIIYAMRFADLITIVPPTRYAKDQFVAQAVEQTWIAPVLSLVITTNASVSQYILICELVGVSISFSLDPCTISFCGLNAQCKVRNHQALCSCPTGMTGNPIERCNQKLVQCSVRNPCTNPAQVCAEGVCSIETSFFSCLQKKNL